MVFNALILESYLVSPKKVNWSSAAAVQQLLGLLGNVRSFLADETIAPDVTARCETSRCC